MKRPVTLVLVATLLVSAPAFAADDDSKSSRSDRAQKVARDRRQSRQRSW